MCHRNPYTTTPAAATVTAFDMAANYRWLLNAQFISYLFHTHSSEKEKYIFVEFFCFDGENGHVVSFLSAK
jgi:hypothetical protein